MRDGRARDGAVSKGWRSGESDRLPPMWPGFKSRRRRHMWFEFVVGSLLCSERFFSGYSGCLSSKTNISKFQLDQESGGRRTTLGMCYLQIITILLLLLLFVILDLQSLRNDPNCTIKQRVSSLFPFSTFWRFQSPSTRT